MRRALLLPFVLALALSFTFEKNNQMTSIVPASLEPTSMPKSCENTQIQNAYNAIAVCQTSLASDTVSCIKSLMISKLNQKWNVFARGPSTDDGITYWPMNSCYIQLSNYGSIGRTYVLWPYANYFPQAMAEKSKPDSQISHFGDCSTQSYNAAHSAVVECDFGLTKQESTSCIVNKLKTLKNQYWNACILDYGKSASSVTFWYYDHCGLVFPNYGAQLRDYYVWKALPS